MGVLWILSTAVAAILVFYVQSDHVTEIAYGRPEDIDAGSVFGFRPCLDASCENYDPAVSDVAIPSDHEPNNPKKGEHADENPRVHCIMLKPSAVHTFGEIESMHPGISDIKYRILEELIEHMYSFAVLKVDNCQPSMKLIDLVILAANSLRTEYILNGEQNCTYEEHDSVEHGKHVYEEHNGVKHGKHGYEKNIPSDVTGVIQSADKPCEPGSKGYNCTRSIMEKPIHKPCPDGVTEYPCHGTVDGVTEDYSEIEVVAEEETHFPIVGSLRGEPGVDYPNYKDIPITSFTCADKKYIPGFYADLETRCQVFHVCYEHRRESFLCPIGTVFNQPILACDYWYSSNCSLTTKYYDVNEKTGLKEEAIDVEVEEILTSIAEDEKSKVLDSQNSVESDLEEITPFFPVKAVVTDLKPEIPVKHKIEADKVASIIVDNIVADTTKVISNAREFVQAIPEPPKQILKVDSYPSVKKPMKMHDLLAQAAIPFTAAKLAAIPVSKASAMKTTVPIAKAKVVLPVAAAKVKLATKVAASPFLAKTKMAASIPAAKVALTKAAVLPAAKIAPAVAKAAIVPAAKVAVVKAAAAPIIAKAAAVPTIKVAAKKTAVPIAASVSKLAAKSSIPALKAKMVASAVPIMKTKAFKSAGAPLLKAKMLALPLAKSKALSVPLAKVKLAKAAAISPLTKKALALGYMKLLKAKKVALMG